jgi:TonB family protein
MSVPCPDSPPWSRRRWVWFVVGMLVAHTGLVFWLGERSQPAGVVTSPEPLLKLVGTLPTTPAVALSPQLSDPTLFALPSHQGFSGAAWLDASPTWPAPPVWAEPPRWLPPRTSELGADFLRFIATNRHNGSFVEAALELPASTADVLLFNDAVTTQTLVRIQGPLTKRPMTAPVTVRDPVHPDALSDTVIQVRVNQDGLNESAIVVQGCGVKSVDESALTAARAARFLPAARGPAGEAQGSPAAAAWGRIVFQWFTVLPAVTNVTGLN